MARISKKTLDKEIESQIYNQFWKTLTNLVDYQHAKDFFSDILTKTEQLMLAKRLATALLLLRGKTATQIRKTLNISFTTIASVSAWVKNARPKTKEVLLSLSNQKDWEAVIDRIDKLLDSLPPLYGTNWSRVAKDRYKRGTKRSARNALR
jgi:uncharacterized protein YerC